MDSRNARRMKTIVLLSGGLDSCVLATLAQKEGETLALSFDYNQRHKQELKAAEAIAKHLNIEHHIIPVSIRGNSALVDTKKPVAKNRSLEEMASQGIPSTYVPARNTLFLSYGASFAEAMGATKIYFGANLYDHACYPDCRPAFFKAFNDLLQIAIAGPLIKIETPLLNMSKKEIILEGLRLNAPLPLSFSCYDPYEIEACGSCDACRLRKKGFEEAYAQISTLPLITSYTISHDSRRESGPTLHGPFCGG